MVVVELLHFLDEPPGRRDQVVALEGGVLLQHVPQDVQQLPETLVARIPLRVGLQLQFIWLSLTWLMEDEIKI